MLVRLFFDAGRAWNSLYFSGVPVGQANKIKSAFAYGAEPRCWHNVVVSEDDNVVEVKANFHSGVDFDCLGCLENKDDVWREKVRDMNKGIMRRTKEQMVREMLENEAKAKKDCCLYNFKSGKCKNPFVVENLGRVLLPHLYPNAKQK